MIPYYIIIYTDHTGQQHTEYYETTIEMYKRYEDLRTSGTTLKGSIYTKMVDFISKAE